MNHKHRPYAVQPAWDLAFLLLFCLLLCAAIPGYCTSPNETRPTPRKIIAVIPADFPPTYFRDPATDQPAGFSVDVLNEVAQRAGFQVEYIYAKSWDLMEEAVLSGRADLVPNLTINEKRLMSMIFTLPVETLKISLIARASDTAHNRIEAGMKIGVMKGSSVDNLLSKRTDITMLTYQGLQQLLMDLLAGRVDLAMTAAPNILKMARDADIEDRIRIIEPSMYEAKRGMALCPGNETLRDQLNKVIYEFVATPEYQNLYQKWWGKPVPFWNTRRVVWTMAGVVAVLVTIFLVLRFRERKRAQEALQESETMLQAIFDTVGTGIIIIDKDTQIIIEANSTAVEMTGLPKERIVGQSCHSVVCPVQAGNCPIKDIVQSVDHSERKLLCADGHLKDILKTVYPITIKGKDCYLESFIDISSRKQAEVEKRSMEERLQRAERMESLGLLAGGVAHDLNNVLGIVVGYAEMLIDETDKSNPMRDDLKKILEGGNRSAAIVQDLLTLARRGVQARKVVNLNATITDCQKTPEFEKVFSYNPQVKLKTDLESDLLNIMGSPVHLGKTIINLAANAVEAMPNGGVLIIATTNQYLDKPLHGYDNIREGDYVVVTVSDTGEGIPERDIKRIFEPFYTKKIMGRSGTGLGLAVVWGTIKDHNGYINIESIEGKGTTFTLYFPVTREETDSELISVSISEYMGKGETILVVDDIKGQRELASRMLSKLNYKVSTVASGEEAVEYVKTNKADLIVLDMIMDPGIDGLETYRRLMEMNPAQKAIIVSGFSESERVKEAQELGAGAYVRKPYVLERLGMAVRKELDKTYVGHIQ